nr:hypothetical protein [uncultured bacterium]
MVVIPILLTLSVSETEAHEGTPHWQQASDWPDRIITTLSSNPCRSFSITWRSDASVENTIGQIY